MGASVKREVNKRYRLLEIELDAVFRWGLCFDWVLRG